MRAITSAVLAIVAIACSTTLAHAANRSFQRSLNANGKVALNVCTNSGNIHVYGVDGNTIHISGNVHSSNSWHMFSGSQSDIDQIAAHPPIQQDGNSIHVGNHDTCGGHVFGGNIAIDYEISVPKNATVEASNGSGDIRVETIAGFVHAATGSGNVRANGIGSDSKLETGSGDIDVQGANGALKAQTGSGNLNIRDSQVTDANLQAGSGDITAGDVRGSLKADSGSGNLTIYGSPTSDWKLVTGSGSIHFHADPEAKFTLDAASGSGGIDSKLTVGVSGAVTRGVLRGPVNGGGPVVKLYTGSGSIDLQ